MTNKSHTRRRIDCLETLIENKLTMEDSKQQQHKTGHISQATEKKKENLKCPHNECEQLSEIIRLSDMFVIHYFVSDMCPHRIDHKQLHDN